MARKSGASYHAPFPRFRFGRMIRRGFFRRRQALALLFHLDDDHEFVGGKQAAVEIAGLAVEKPAAQHIHIENRRAGRKGMW